MRKLFLVVGIFAFGAVLVLSFLPRMVFAQTSGLTTIELLQKQIQDLLAVVQSLQKQVSELKSELGASAPIISSATSSISVIVSTTSIITSIISEEPASEVSELVLPTFTRQLSRGASGEDVRKLQEFFAQDKSLYPEGLITGYFGPATERAMKKWQEKNNLEAVGRIGPKSIMKLNELMTRGAGKSGIIPPGLLIAPRIQQKFGTSNFATTSIPIYPIYTTTTATTTVQYIYVYSTSTLATSTIATSTTYTTTTTYVYIPPTQTTQQTTTQTTTNTTTTTTNASTTATSTTATNPPIFTITSPNGGEQMTVGNTYTISWTSAGVSVSSVSIDLYKSGSYITHLIDKDNSGNFTWTIPSGLSSITTGSDYKIRIYNNMYYSNYDESNNAFTITVPVTAPSISPIGYWKFDGSGANEISGSPSATKVGNAVFNASGGEFNGYLYIPGSSDYAKIPYNSMFDLPDNFTIEFWFRQRTNQSFNQNLIYKGTPINNYNFNVSRWLWNEYNYGPVIAGHTTVNTGYWTQPSNPNQLAHNEWHHVAFTKSPTYHAYYLDGVLIGSKDVTATSEYGGPAKTPAVDIIIGDTAVDTDFDNVRIYNVALSRSEVLYNWQNVPTVSTPVPTPTPTPTL